MKSQLIQLLTSHFAVPLTALTDSAHFERDLGFDSLERMDMILLLEKELGVAIPDSELPRLRTLGQLAEYLDQQMTPVAN